MFVYALYRGTSVPSQHKKKKKKKPLTLVKNLFIYLFLFLLTEIGLFVRDMKTESECVLNRDRVTAVRRKGN